MLGRKSAPHPKPEIRVITDTSGVQRALNETRNQMNEELKKSIFHERHTVKSKNGETKIDEKIFVSYDKNVQKNHVEENSSQISISEKKSSQIIQKSSIITYSIAIGRSFEESGIDYQLGVSIPIFHYTNLNFSYELNHKTVFSGISVWF